MHARFWVVVGLVVLLAFTLPVGGCGDNDNGAPCCAVCGDGACTGDEGSCNCPQDCGSDVCSDVRPECGDGACERSGSPGESHERCPADCPLGCEVCEDSLLLVFAGGIQGRGSSCPDGFTEAYRDSGYLVCDECASSADCPEGEGCHTQCGPGCEDDTDGCCPVRVCSSF